MSDTRLEILTHAEKLARTHGANGFSYADLASKIGIRKASIHYHFPSKSDLFKDLIQDYHERHRTALGQLATLDSPRKKLFAFVEIYKQGLTTDALCLCGMLTLDSSALTDEMREKLDNFFEDTEAWLTTVFDEGSEQQWELVGTPEQEAKMFLALVQGTQLISRNALDKAKKFDQIVQQQLNRYK